MAKKAKKTAGKKAKAKKPAKKKVAAKKTAKKTYSVKAAKKTAKGVCESGWQKNLCREKVRNKVGSSRNQGCRRRCRANHSRR